MVESPVTRPSLLLRIRDRANHEAWEQFVTLYGPLVYQFVRKRGLQDADAADLTQTVFQAIAQQIQGFQYDAQQGTFRGWLFAVTRNQLRKFLEGARHTKQVVSWSAEMPDLADDSAVDPDEALWDIEFRRRLFYLACERVRPDFGPTSWMAFWQTAVEGRCAQDVGHQLSMSVGAVYTAKSRILAQLKIVAAQLQHECR